jgi:hypothetical protein
MSIITGVLARRIEAIDIDYSRSRLAGMQAAPGNPLGIEIRQFGQATAFLIQGWPDFWYGNKIVGLEPGDEPYLEEIVAFFRDRQLDFRVEIIPGNLNSRLGAHLHRLGLYQGGFSAAVYGVPYSPEEAGSGVTVDEIQPGELDLFLDLYQAGFELPPLTPADKEIVKGWYEREKPSLKFYIARVEGTPAGIGVFYANQGLGLLADAGTLPQFRGKGCQSALIRQRLAEAARQNCEFITSFVEFGSTSHRNLEKAGLRLAYTKAMWFSE